MQLVELTAVPGVKPVNPHSEDPIRETPMVRNACQDFERIAGKF